MTTSGFYKLENEVLLFGPNTVLSPEYHLVKEEKDNYQFPIDGWYWFETEDEAYNFFGLQKPTMDENLYPFGPFGHIIP